MSVVDQIDKARKERGAQLFAMPPECAVSLTIANRGENEKGACHTRCVRCCVVCADHTRCAQACK